MTEVITLHMMPAPPVGMAWQLKVESSGKLVLQLFKAKTFQSSKPSGWSESFHSVRRAGSIAGWLNIDEHSVDVIVEGVIMAAHEMIKEIAERPGKKAAREVKLNQISDRLGGITIKDERR